MNCQVCGKELSGKQLKFCSDRCGRIAQHRRARGQDEFGTIRRRCGYIYTDDSIQKRVNTKSSKILYLGGYTDDKGKTYKWKDIPVECFMAEKRVREMKANCLDTIKEILSDWDYYGIERPCLERKKGYYKCETILT